MLIATSRLSSRPPSLGDAGVLFRPHRDPLACAHNPSDLVWTGAPRLDAVGEDGPDWVFTSGIDSGS